MLIGAFGKPTYDILRRKVGQSVGMCSDVNGGHRGVFADVSYPKVLRKRGVEEMGEWCRCRRI
jgi:hypothetical protein